jgi:hypothetical protein
MVYLREFKWLVLATLIRLQNDTKSTKIKKMIGSKFKWFYIQILIMFQPDAQLGFFHPLGVTALGAFGCEIPSGCIF